MRRHPAVRSSVFGLAAVAAVAAGAAPAVLTAGVAGASTSAPKVVNGTNLDKQPVVKPGKKPAPTKLVTKDLVVGTGTTAAAGDTVVVKYVGVNYANGKPFTNQTWKAGKATSFSLDQVIPGFAQGIEGMKVGGRREIVIPWKLGYGTRGAGSTIKPKENLVFVVDLQSIAAS
ncbi:MAG TPA: FKBP-type peptidyl-prolyl cis-trans isomerase [Acidimicrobiales bacterium]|nr:FKBP-type peptidyl-prolyl cis-trans isomerase [Acidimicrobiales bacterium]